MINQQLLDYIKAQLAAGVTKETLKTNLLAIGWPEENVTQGLTMAESGVVLPPSPNVNNGGTPNLLWTKAIPKTNIVSLIIYLVLLVGVDTPMVISSNDLLPFLLLMFGVFGVFMIFFCLENLVYKKQFANSTSGLDNGIMVVIALRNILFLLNFIPFIQLLGIAGLVMVGWILAIIYIVLIIARSKAKN